MARLSEHGIRLSSVRIFFILSCIRHIFVSVTDVLPCELFGRLSLKKKIKKSATFVFVFVVSIPHALKMSPSFLNSNSTSHIWPFSAVAELVGEDFSISIFLFFFLLLYVHN